MLVPSLASRLTRMLGPLLSVLGLPLATACSTTESRNAASTRTVPPTSATLNTEPPRAIPTDILFASLEGPFWVKDGEYLIFSDVVEKNDAAAQIYRYDPGSGTTLGRFSRAIYPVTPTSTNG